MRSAVTSRKAAPQSGWRLSAYGLLLALPSLLFLVALTLGRYPISLSEVVRIFLSLVDHSLAAGISDTATNLVLRVRLPRTLVALLIGASLGITGAGFQGIFKNPLVDSNILGVTSGAGFGAALALFLSAKPWQVQISAFVFGLVAVALAFTGSRLYKTAPMIVLTLMGILIGSFFMSLTSLLKTLADPLDTLPAITFWLLGGLTGITWKDVPWLAAITLAGSIYLLLTRWRFNILSLGDEEAVALGVNPNRLKIAMVVFSTLMTAAAVSVGGVIGWVGLVIPHAGRILVGPDHRRLLPASLSLGASFLLVIDNISRVALPGEVPIGVLTGLIGVPMLIALLFRNRTGWQ
jgi:iron complex transport system permease protein